MWTQYETEAVTQLETGSSRVGSRWKWVLYAGAFVSIVAAAKLLHFQDLLKTALDWIGNLGAWGPVIFIGIYVVAAELSRSPHVFSTRPFKNRADMK